MDWDEEGWHYSADADTCGPLTAQYIFVLDALNFCFWPTEGCVVACAAACARAPGGPPDTHWGSYEYDSLAINLKRALEADCRAFDASRLVKVDESTVARWMGRDDVSQLDERVAKLREVRFEHASRCAGPTRPDPPLPPKIQLGHALESSFGGLAFNLLRAARSSAAEVVRLITAHFPGFRDVAVHQGRQVFLYKRAQILAADVWAAYGRRTRDSPSPPGCPPQDAIAFFDISALTMFGARSSTPVPRARRPSPLAPADYRVPQLLRPMGVLCYSDALTAAVDARQELPAGSEVRGKRGWARARALIYLCLCVRRGCRSLNPRHRSAASTRAGGGGDPRSHSAGGGAVAGRAASERQGNDGRRAGLAPVAARGANARHTATASPHVLLFLLSRADFAG